MHDIFSKQLKILNENKKDIQCSLDLESIKNQIDKQRLLCESSSMNDWFIVPTAYIKVTDEEPTIDII